MMSSSVTMPYLFCIGAIINSLFYLYFKVKFGLFCICVSDFRSLFVAIVMLLFSAILAPVLYHLWVYAGSGNANFFYAATLAFNLAQVSLYFNSYISQFNLPTIISCTTQAVWVSLYCKVGCSGNRCPVLAQVTLPNSVFERGGGEYWPWLI